MKRDDADAIFAFLSTRSAVELANRPHELRFPFNLQASLAVWRTLFFRPGTFEDDPRKTAEWNRGAYLVRGLGHCDACHSTRNVLGATIGTLELGGGVMPVVNWYAPSLASSREAGVADWSIDEIARLLKSGTSIHGFVRGPMAEVVFRGTQHLDDGDLRAIATFLKELPQSPDSRAGVRTPAQDAMDRGKSIYADRCAQCHGERGEGWNGAYPALAGSRKVAAASPMNVLRTVLDGGFPPATSENPRPYGMPPFGQVLSNAEIAVVVTYVRNAWGNRADPVSELDVLRLR